MVVKRVGVWSFARMASLIYAIIGFIAGVIIAFVSLLGALGAAAHEVPFLGAILGAGAIFILPIFYGLVGLIIFGGANSLASSGFVVDDAYTTGSETYSTGGGSAGGG